ncbi:MAG TPA: DegT/DnrJ/EryC1/StrS family aminotransferase [Thermoanaerobaculia bacterium]|nr:DegT/DnrJ/EryC1/StrS family aminotransferase [Thermoanaerobaculia bacterium]HUM28667.1 DegT/DnrJ/EryC1/StrS family aminotransferase [Thermoanaerobaculia bacterium]HXK66725.1 DegT/DnrJ/EryC1/StrS family aminotransferase [Thermoanaerobaculia bacterium]
MIPLYDIRLEPASIEQAMEVLKSGNLKQGPWTDRFETAFSERFKVNHALAVSSGTSALHLAIMALFEPGDEILVPSFTFFASASAVALAGCVPVFCDVREDTFTLDIQSAASQMTDRTRGLILVHLFGHPAPVKEVEDFARNHGLKVIHDLAQAHGVRYAGEEVAAMGDAACFSFYPTKNILVGEGGMVTTRHAEVANKIGLLRNHGMDRPYHHVCLGYNYRMTDVEAAIGLGQLAAFDGQIPARRKHDRLLREAIMEDEGVAWQVSPPEGEPVPNLLTGRLLHGSRDTVILRLREAGIGCGVYYPSPLHQQEAFAPFVRNIELPVTENLCTRVFSLPVHPNLSTEEIQSIIQATRNALL